MSYAQAAAKGPKQSPEEGTGVSDSLFARSPTVSTYRPSKQPAALSNRGSTSTHSLLAIDIHPPHTETNTPYTSMPNTNMPSGPSSRAPAPPSVNDSTSSSFTDVDSQHVKTEAQETADTAAQKTSEAADETKEKSSEYMEKAKKKANEAAQYTKEKGSEFADEAGDKYNRAKKSADRNAREAKKEIKSASQDISENRDNPVYIANGILLVAGSAALGYGAYTKHIAGELDWQIAGTWAAAVGVLAVGDYYVSQYLFQNKYPKK